MAGIARLAGEVYSTTKVKTGNRSQSRKAPLTFLLAAVLLLLVSTSALGQVTISVGGADMELEADAPGVLGDVDRSLEESVGEEEEESDAGKGQRRRNWEPVIAPLPSRNPALGWMVSVPAMLMYRPSFSQPGDRVWISSVFGFYAENESWGAGLLQRMSFGGDKWRVLGSLFHGDINYEYFGIGGDGDDDSIVLDQEMDVFLVEGMHRVAPNLFAGLRGIHNDTTIGPRLPDLSLPPGVNPGELSENLTLGTLAPRLQYDTRDMEFYPRNGWLINGTATFGRGAFGSDVNYQRYELSANYFFPLGEKGVLANRLVSRYVSPDAPFFLFPAFGQRSDLRGYQSGSYRDAFMVAGQTEYRHRFNPRFGAVAFAGIGSVAPDFLGWGESLWSVGAGVRWVLAPENNISLRVDVARGRDETSFYVGVGEAF